MLDQCVQGVVATYLEVVDALAPGVVEGLYLHGSVALDDFRAAVSDIDFVAVVSAPLGPAGIEALRRAHQRLRRHRPRPLFEGTYVTWDDLARDPELSQPGPHTHYRGFGASGRAHRNPITWHTLASAGVVCRGPSLASVRVWTDPVRLASWTRGNLDTYWGTWQARGNRFFSVHGLATMTSQAVTWGVLGVVRLHYTLATGQITSKEKAGLYALETFPERWHGVIGEALRIRRGCEGRASCHHRLARRRQALDFVSMVIDDALSR